MRANQLLKHNIDTLLRARGQTRKDLAQWCRKSESWISKIYKETRRGFSLRDCDRIAEFFGIATYQLFQPGISKLTERRSHLERRSAKERRLGHTARFMMDTAMEIDAHHPRRKGGSHVAVVASSPLHEALARIAEDTTKRIAAAVRQFEIAGERTPKPRKALPPALPRGGTDRPEDAGGTKKA